MANPPEQRRLFEIETDEQSKSETPRPARPDPTARPVDPSRNGTGHDTLDLRAASAALGAAEAGLGDAIRSARAAGLSWRAIGTATGVPFQTLHRRQHRTSS
jgi:hypothetical protein